MILANGPLTEPKLPDLPGLADFEGEAFHTARWDEVSTALSDSNSDEVLMVAPGTRAATSRGSAWGWSAPGPRPCGAPPRDRAPREKKSLFLGPKQ